MERVIPSWDTLNNLKTPISEGERAIIEYLDRNLSRDSDFQGDNLANYHGWLIFYQPFMNGNIPNIVVYNPDIGIQFIEVKNWSLEKYSITEDDHGKLLYFERKENLLHEVNSPLYQIEYYKEKLTGQLVPQIGEAIDKNKSNYSLVKVSLYFHNINTQTIKDKFKKHVLDFKHTPVFGFDFLEEQNLKEIIPDSSREKSYFWKREWNEEILFWLNPPFHSLDQTVQLSLNKYQRLFSDPISGHHRVRGVAGSGKTQVLAYRAGDLASSGNCVLILSFNITLWHYIKDMVQNSPFEFEWNRFVFNHFHGFCKDIINRYGEKWPTDEGDIERFFREIVPNKVLSIINNHPNYLKYDAVYIDEGQDYYFEWYDMLRHFLTERDEIVVVCDKKQNIYGRSMQWLDKRRTGVEKFGDWIDLKTVVRMPEGVAEISKRFSESYGLDQDVQIEQIERPNLFNQYVEHTLWENIQESDWLYKIEAAYELIISDTIIENNSDIVVLLPNKIFGFKCVHFFENTKNIKVNHVFENEEEKRHHTHKKSFWMGDNRLKMSTIHSFKGWEALHVIIFIPEEFFGGNELNDRKVYTAMTRTKQNLVVLNANPRYSNFGEDLPKRWGNKSLDITSRIQEESRLVESQPNDRISSQDDQNDGFPPAPPHDEIPWYLQ